MPTQIGNSVLTGLLTTGPNGQLVATTKGALIGNDGTRSIPILAGPEGSVLTVNSATASGLSWNPAIKNNYTANTAPTVNDDDTQGYSVGSIWIDQTTGNVYIASSVATGAADWELLSGIGFTARNGLILTGNILDVAGSATILSQPGTLNVNSSAIAGQVLQSTGTVNTPAVYGSVNLANPNAVTGTLAVTSGGTGATSFVPNSFVVADATGTALISASFPAPVVATVTTINATPTTLLTLPTTVGNAYSIELVVVAKAVPIAIGQYLSFREFIGFANIGGTVNVVTADALIIYGPNLIWTVTLVPSGSDLLVQVTGEAATTINWKGSVEYLDV